MSSGDSTPGGRSVSLPARQANSHCASVGRSKASPAFVRKMPKNEDSAGASGTTVADARSPRSVLWKSCGALPARPPVTGRVGQAVASANVPGSADRMRRYCSCVVSKTPIQKSSESDIGYLPRQENT